MLKALNEGAYKYKAWVIHCFSKTIIPDHDQFLYRLYIGNDTYYFIDPETKETINLEDATINKPPFHFREPLHLKKGEVINLKEDVESTYGQLLANTIALIHPFKDKIPYQAGEFKIANVEEEIIQRLTSDPAYQTKHSVIHPDPIYVTEYLEFIDSILSLEGYSQLCVPSASPKTLTSDPKIIKRREELLKEYEGQLHDPAIVAKIEKELIDIDKAWIKGDISEGFFLNENKAFGVTRKKAYIMQGYDRGFGVQPDTITTSLSEGWDLEKMPAIINSLREGAYARGKGTELGGVATKVVNRMFQNTGLIDGDCGTTLGWNKLVTKENKKQFIGYYYLEKGHSILITPENFPQLVGQTITLRSPQFCKAEGVKFCRYCLGIINSESEKSLGAYVANMTSQLMNIEMSRNHGTVLKTAPFNVKKFIS